jgi:TonB-linked SusC/RagA family outer membrane protein
MGSKARMLTALVAALAVVLGASTSLFAQATGTVRGTVTEAGSGRPVNGAQVSIPGTGRSAVTGASGQYTIVNVPAGNQRVRAEVIGFAAQEKPVTVAAGQEARVDLTLGQQAVALDALVVTGTPGATSKRTLGNAVTQLDAEEITAKTNVNNVTELLQARTPGVQILPNSGIPGVAADIRIRGASSLIGNDPVIFIDGVRFNNEDLGSFTPSGAGATSYSGQKTSAFDFLNPNDIESIEVIKGPAAATLYGAEAANGVIQIITKKGARGEQSVRWDVKLDRGQNEWALGNPINFTTCDEAKIRERDRAGNAVWPGCQGVAAGTVLTDNPLRRDPEALRTGDFQRMSLSARGGGERYSFYFAGDVNEEDGVFRNSYNDRRSLRANFTINPNEKVDLQINTGYARGNLRLPIGDESAQGLLLSAYRGKPGRIARTPEREGWFTTIPREANEYNNTTESDRLTLGSTLNVRPVSWFRNRLTLGLDYTSSLAQILSPPGSTDAEFAGVREGLVGQRAPRNYVYTVDYAGNIEAEVTPDLQATTSFGMQAISKRYEALFALGTGFGAPDVTLIGTAQTTVGSNSFSESKSLGYYVQEQIGWKNRLFLTGAVRADDNSAFGENFDWIYYPKASLSWILSEEPALAGMFDAARISSFKLRTAYGHAGRAPEPFAAAQTYTVDKVVLGPEELESALRARSYGNPDLKAERGEELEAGFDANFLEDRVGVDFTYYDKRMRDVIVAVAAPGSSGFGGTFYGGTSGILRNLGETRNSGVELGITGTAVQRRNFAWDTRLTLATNDNELVSFGDDRKEMFISGQSYGALQRHRAGFPLGGYWAQLPKRNEDGTPVMRGATVVLDTLSFIGPSAPTREIGFSNTFTLFNNFRLYSLFDYKGGHYLYNYNEYNRCRFHGNCARVNDVELAESPEAPVWRQVPGAYVEKADFVKLRDVSLTYTLPSVWAQRFRGSAASLTLAGHNLALWSDYSGIDPEVNSYGNRSFARADIYALPMMRRLSVSLNVGF